MTASENIAMFVGGQWDGRRRIVYDKRPYIYVPKRVPIDYRMWATLKEPHPSTPALECERYRRVELTGVWVALYVLDSIPYERIIDELVTGYRLPRERRDA